MPNADAVTIAVAPASARFAVRLPGEGAMSVRTAGNFTFESKMNTCASAGEHLSLRLGPDEWLLLAPQSDRESVRNVVASAFGTTFSALVDVSDASTAFLLSGTRVLDILSAGCPLDVSDTAFPPGSATRTLFGKAEVILIRPSNERSYRIECLRSFAPYVQGFLQNAALEFSSPL